MKTEVSKKKQLVGMLYGLTAGLAFTIFAWGIDGYLLSRANGAFPWVKFIPGLLICILAGSLVGWLTIRFHNTLLAIIFWVPLAYLFTRLIIWLPLRVTPFVIRFFNEALGDFLKYPIYKTLNQNLIIGLIIIGVVGIICGLLENILVDQSLFSSGTYALAVPLVVSFLCFSLAGNTADSLLNRNFREPIQEVDNLLEFAMDNINVEVPGTVARAMHLGAVNPIKKYLSRERGLILSNYDESMGQVDVLVDFKGKWVKCTVIYNQVTHCVPVFEMPWIRLSNILKLVEGPLFSGQLRN